MRGIRSPDRNIEESLGKRLYKPPRIAYESVSRMATVVVTSPEIGVLGENAPSNATQLPLIDTRQTATAVNLGPCIQYEDAAEDMENVFQVIFVVNSKAQAESLPNSGSMHATEQIELQGDLDQIKVVPPQREGANHAENQEEESQLQAETGCKDETANMIGWFRSTFSQIERNGTITLKEFKKKAGQSDVGWSKLAKWYNTEYSVL